jgi:hypothetical protein
VSSNDVDRFTPDGAYVSTSTLTVNGTCTCATIPKPVPRSWPNSIAAATGIFKTAYKKGRREPSEAYAADALLELARGEGRRASGARPKIIWRVDLPAFLRGAPLEGETCEIAGYGPVAVSAVRDLLATDNPILTAVLTKGTEVVGVAHLGRRPNTAFLCVSRSTGPPPEHSAGRARPGPEGQVPAWREPAGARPGSQPCPPGVRSCREAHPRLRRTRRSPPPASRSLPARGLRLRGPEICRREAPRYRYRCRSASLGPTCNDRSPRTRHSRSRRRT